MKAPGIAGSERSSPTYTRTARSSARRRFTQPILTRVSQECSSVSEPRSSLEPPGPEVGQSSSWHHDLVKPLRVGIPVPSTYSSDRLTPLSGGIRDGAHLRVAPPPRCPDSAAAPSVARARPWPTISVSGSVVVVDVFRQDPQQMPFADHHDMVNALSSNRSNHALGIGVLPGRAGRNDHFPDVPRLGLT